jgi:hypothetical protein
MRAFRHVTSLARICCRKQVQMPVKHRAWRRVGGRLLGLAGVASDRDDVVFFSGAFPLFGKVRRHRRLPSTEARRQAGVMTTLSTGCCDLEVAALLPRLFCPKRG